WRLARWLRGRSAVASSRERNAFYKCSKRASSGGPGRPWQESRQSNTSAPQECRIDTPSPPNPAIPTNPGSLKQKPVPRPRRSFRDRQEKIFARIREPLEVKADGQYQQKIESNDDQIHRRQMYQGGSR